MAKQGNEGYGYKKPAKVKRVYQDEVALINAFPMKMVKNSDSNKKRWRRDFNQKGRLTYNYGKRKNQRVS